MKQKEIEEKYIKYFKIEYTKIVSDLLIEVNNEKEFIDLSKYTSKFSEMPKKITKAFLKQENIEDFLFTDNISFSYDFSFYLEFLSYKDYLNLNSKIIKFLVIIQKLMMSRPTYNI